MLIKLDIQNFRSFEHIQIDNFQKINLIGGKNNSGKTSLLEALLLNFYPDLNNIIFLKNIRNELISLKAEEINKSYWHYFFFNKNQDNAIIISANNRIKAEDDKYIEFERNTKLEIKEYNHQYFKEDNDSFLINNDNIQNINNYNYFDNNRNKLSTLATKKDIYFDVQSTIIITENMNILHHNNFHYIASIVDYNIKVKNIIDGLDNSINTDIDPQVIKEHINNLLKENNDIKPLFFLSSFTKKSRIELAKSFDLAVLNNQSQRILNILQKLDPSITEIRSLNIGEADIYLRRKGEKFLPISLFGECFNRVLDIILRLINTRNAVCLIDEIENGIHYQNQREFWRSLFQLAIELNIQIFATTHSLEMIQAFADVGLEYPNEGTYFELARHEKTNQIVSIKRDLDVLQYSLKHEGGVGLRGE